MTRSEHRVTALSRFALVTALAAAPVALMSADSAAASSTSRPATSSRPLLAGFHWARLRQSPLGPRSQPILAWTGKELIELGGLRRGNTTQDGAAYDPATGRWHTIAPMRVNVGFDNATTAWTGRQLFVTNGQVASCLGGEPLSNCLARAGLYDPATNHWTTTLLPKAMAGMFPEASVWTGHDIVLAAVNGDRGRLAVAAYNPVTRHWHVITPRTPKRHPARFVALAAAPGRVLLWSAWSRVNTTAGSFGVDVEALTQGRWRDVTGNWPQNHTLTAFAYTKRGIMVSPSQFWCGIGCPGPFVAFPGFFANPVSLHRTAIKAGPLGQAIPLFIWTGRAIIAVNLGASVDGPGVRIRPDDMAMYNPAAKRWFRLAAAPGRPALSVAPIWTGTELLTLTDSGRLMAFRR
jgi:hypothetical protein